MLNIPCLPYSVLGYNRTITPTNIKVLLNIGPGAGEGRKKRGKNSNLPNTFDYDCSIRLFYRRLLQRFFFLVLKSLVNCPTSYANDKGFFRGPDILHEGEEGGGSLQGHQQLACVQTPPPAPSPQKKMRFFLKRGASVLGLAAASLAIQSLRRVQLQSMQLGKTEAFHFRLQILGKLIQEIFQVKWNIFFYVWSLVFVADSLSDENFATLR